jgi:glycerol-3-phosphate dehydrogenase
MVPRTANPEMSARILPDVSKIEFDLVVIGAGINGAGIARDAVLRGLKVLLLDKGDIGGGTSSASTRLIHGGLRYLEHLEFGLVRESLREREILLKVAPHLVRPLPILIPIYKDNGRGPLTINAGMIAYDLLSFDKTLPRYRMLSRTGTLAQAPGLNSQGLLGAAVYYDGQVEFAERLVLENVLAARSHGATVITYARVSRLVVESGHVRGLEFVTDATGRNHTARGKMIINAAGPWVDQLLEQTTGGTQSLIGGTKGSHIVVAPFPGAPSSAIYVEAKTDRRPFFIIPWNGNYLIGTTDIRFDGDLDRVRCDSSEVDYLLVETNRVLPQSKLTRKEILYTYSGVRPLPMTDGKNAQSITRRHFIREHPQIDNLLSVVGGKLTTYRSLAEQSVDLVFRKLKKNSVRCTTAQVSLPGGTEFAAFANEFREQNPFAAAVNNRLLRIYGTRANDVVQFCMSDAALSRPFNKAADVLAGEVVFSFAHELAESLSDCLLRRTMVGLNGDLAIGDDETAADIGKRFLGWSPERAENELKTYRSFIERLRVGTERQSNSSLL